MLRTLLPPWIDLSWASVLLVVLTVLILLGRFALVTSGKRQLPPGPRGLPILGNAFQLSRNAWTIFEDWKGQYGPIIYLNIAGQPFVVFNTSKVAFDLLTRRANKYSDRHRTIVGSEILTGGLHIAFARYGEGWRRLRRAAHEGLHKDVLHSFHAVQSLEAVVLADSLIRDPDSWDNHLQRTTASTIMAVTYNLPPLESETDPSIAHIRAHMDRLAYALYPGNYLVEIFPWMNYIPASLAKWKRDAQAWFVKDSETFLDLMNDTLRRAEKDDHPSFVASAMAQKHRHGLSDLDAAWLAASLYGAGAETSYSALQWFILAMVRFPEMQKQAQLEIDQVVGRSRLPEFLDEEQLPYVCALVREVLRWRPPIPLGLPHRLTEDDWYEGYFLPKGTLCIANVWAINRDEDVYGPDAHLFNPDRHLDEHGQLAPAVANTQDEGHASYGFGRRMCVGRHIGNASLFIDFATVLWACEISPHVDDQGQVQLPDVYENTNTGLTLHPAPFKCSIKPRCPDATAILQEARDLGSHK
ncbi:hypothetical protein JAAARDRAFT_35334 [Jaapia argillacea MUCL 33604]|uniref:Cytochrome P450 n=1 Tax=Jaapia argillacea MUCL 33604 TaxID=933084 RepID=A0A067PUU9_9AGAM|nr:hypothetical protein JAAARDRAFT_35334 [Jaapia argillacea MUCL 33604]